jgi:hypothetical protein
VEKQLNAQKRKHGNGELRIVTTDPLKKVEVVADL